MGDECPSASAAPKTRKRARDDGDFKRVAEIVMVLSALGQMRGGKEPTAAEKALVAEAKERLVVMCEACVKPKELFSTEAVRVVAEDLGLNRSKDPALGFRPPRMSIAEKLMLTKKKMEVSKETNEHSSVHSFKQLPVSVGVKSESRGIIPSGASRISQDKSPMPISSGGFRNSSPISHVPVLACAAPNLKQSQISDAHAGVNTIKHSSSSLDKALPSAHNELNARPSGPSYLTQDQAENLPQKIPTISSMQSPSVAAMSRFSQPNKMLDHTSIRSEGIAGANANQSSHQMKNQEIKSSTIQAGQGGLHVTHQPPQGLAFFHTPSLYTNHNEIGKSVQRILQSKVLDHPSWIPPSSDYMNASLNCQICKNVISDTESLLVCDACEKGNHLKCLQSYGSKDIPKVEWHCPSCLASSNGKTLPPKYGRVTRAPVPAPRAAPNTSINAASKKTEDLDPNASRQKALTNSNSNASQHSKSSNLGGNHDDSIPDSMVVGAEMDLRTNGVKRDNEKCDAVGDHLEETNGSVCANSDASCWYPNHIENDSLASSNTKETTEPVLQTNTVGKSSCERSQSLVDGNYHFSKATVAQDSDQDLSSNDRISGNHLQENSATTTSEPEGHGEKKPPECIDASSVEVVSQSSLQVTADESKGLVS